MKDLKPRKLLLEIGWRLGGFWSNVVNSIIRYPASHQNLNWWYKLSPNGRFLAGFTHDFAFPVGKP